MIDLETLFGLRHLERPPALPIPIDRMIVRWACADPSHTVTRLRVVDVADQTACTGQEYPFSEGAGRIDWLTEPLSTPLGIFVQLLVDGFPNPADVRAALYQFRQVEGQQDWTSALLFQLEDPDIEGILDREDLWRESRDDAGGADRSS
jgi:hypothetical protein